MSNASREVLIWPEKSKNSCIKSRAFKNSFRDKEPRNPAPDAQKHVLVAIKKSRKNTGEFEIKTKSLKVGDLAQIKTPDFCGHMEKLSKRRCKTIKKKWFSHFYSEVFWINCLHGNMVTTFNTLIYSKYFPCIENVFKFRIRNTNTAMIATTMNKKLNDFSSMTSTRNFFFNFFQLKILGSFFRKH